MLSVFAASFEGKLLVYTTEPANCSNKQGRPNGQNKQQKERKSAMLTLCSACSTCGLRAKQPRCEWEPRCEREPHRNERPIKEQQGFYRYRSTRVRSMLPVILYVTTDPGSLPLPHPWHPASESLGNRNRNGIVNMGN